MKKTALAATAAILFASAGARADILNFGTREGNYTNTTPYADVTVPINGTYGSIKFTTTEANEIVRITYNAECGVLGPPGSFLAVIIKVDGVEATPASGTSFAFCTAVSTTTYSWTGAVRQSVTRVPKAGSHTLTLSGYGYNTSTWWLGDSSIVVDR